MTTLETEGTTRKKRLTKPYTFLERAEGYLEAHKRAMTHPVYASLPAATTQFVLNTAVARQDGAIYSDAIPAYRNVASVKMVSVVLASHYFQQNGYSEVSDVQLSRETCLNLQSVRLNTDYLMLTGLWGKVEGTGKISSRYYPLFNEKGMAEFLKVIDIAELGLNPLTGLAFGEKPNFKKPKDTSEAKATEPTKSSEETKPAEPIAQDAAPVGDMYFADGVPIPAEPDKHFGEPDEFDDWMATTKRGVTL